MLNSIKLDCIKFYAKIQIWPRLGRITRLNRIKRSSGVSIGGPFTSYPCARRAQYNLIWAMRWGQQRKQKNFKKACRTNHLRTYFWMITAAALLRLLFFWCCTSFSHEVWRSYNNLLHLSTSWSKTPKPWLSFSHH